MPPCPTGGPRVSSVLVALGAHALPVCAMAPRGIGVVTVVPE